MVKCLSLFHCCWCCCCYIDDYYKYTQFSADEVEDFRFQSYFSFTAMYDIQYWTLKPAAEALKQLQIRQMINFDMNYHFDLIIYQECSQESWLMFAYKFHAPIVVIGKANIVKIIFLI